MFFLREDRWSDVSLCTANDSREGKQLRTYGRNELVEGRSLINRHEKEGWRRAFIY